MKKAIILCQSREIIYLKHKSGENFNIIRDLSLQVILFFDEKSTFY
jgi:hypothetical protein